MAMYIAGFLSRFRLIIQMKNISEKDHTDIFSSKATESY